MLNMFLFAGLIQLANMLALFDQTFIIVQQITILPLQ